MRRTTTAMAALLLGLPVMVGCSKSKPEPAPTPEPVVEDTHRADSIAMANKAREDSIARARAEEAERQRMAQAAQAERDAMQARLILAQQNHYEFDKSDLRPGDLDILDRKVAILQANPGLQLEIAGHCDERGSQEYNLALGNRRALAARQYLVNRGIDASRLSVVSYGEERPVFSKSSEDAWAMNRRAEYEATTSADRLVLPSGL